MADSTSGAATSASTDGKRGDIGRQTYDDVRRLIDKGMNKTEAFAEVARETGRSAATVTTTYYRMAKRQPDGGGVRKTARTAARSARRTASTQTDRVVQDARTAIDNLHRHIEELEGQIEELTARSKELDKIKRTLNRI
jgi:hypothetical protein